MDLLPDWPCASPPPHHLRAMTGPTFDRVPPAMQCTAMRTLDGAPIDSESPFSPPCFPGPLLRRPAPASLAQMHCIAGICPSSIDVSFLSFATAFHSQLSAWIRLTDHPLDLLADWPTEITALQCTPMRTLDGAPIDSESPLSPPCFPRPLLRRPATQPP